MSTEFGMALSALIGVVGLIFEVTYLKYELNNEVELFRKYIESLQGLVASLTNRAEQNTYDIGHLSESCSKINDLDIKAKINQKDIERAMDMIEELKAKRSMDVLDKLREEDKK